MSAEEVVEALAQALASLSVHTLPVPADHRGPDLILDLPKGPVALEVKHYALVDQPRAGHILRQLDGRPQSPNGVLTVVVSGRIVAGAREQLREAGVSWFDLRGHLYLTGPDLHMDVSTKRDTHRAPGRRAFAGRVGLATAVDIMLFRPDQVGVREIARRIHAAPSSVSDSMKWLRAEGLVDQRGGPDYEALFWATAREWKPAWIPVASYPNPDGPMRNPALKLGFEDPGSPGWALGGDVAASHLGAPIGLAAGATPDFYIPTRQAHRLACSILGETRDMAAPAARLAVAPIAAVCEHRVDVADGRDEHWLLARPLFVALDLAQDPGRGAEILRDWHPQIGGIRAW